ncbi:SDR family oxidoreductase [Amycolatopsis sp. VS8301801F10]|uniref:SDR family oxidoreductase n=1 Tax=Amycolatopsis sp. VS8301801F10 TaxID=2652442 RepID=UPI0038FCF8CD
MPPVVVVTGASAGVGRAVARAYGARGAKVALLARGEKGLAAAAEDVHEAGGTPLELPTDVADFAQVDAAASRAEEELGPIDVWVNVAFSSVFARFADIRPDEYRRVTEVTYLGFVHGTMAALERMKPRDAGTIVQVGSALAYRGIPLQSAYCGAKHAIQGFNEALRCELLHEHSGIRTTMVQLPAVNTPQFSWLLSRLPEHAQPVPPIYQPELAARAVLHAADHPRRREYWVGTSTAATLLANAVAPGLLDRYLARTGFGAQQTGQPQSPAQPANLWEPADGPRGFDYGAHGEFDQQAKAHDVQPVLSRHHGAVAAGVAAAAVAAGQLLRRTGKSTKDTRPAATGSRRKPAQRKKTRKPAAGLAAAGLLLRRIAKKDRR